MDSDILKIREGLRPQKIDMQNTRPGKCKDQTKTAEKTEWQRTEIQSSEFRGDRVLGRLGRLKAIREQYENRCSSHGSAGSC